MPISRKKFKSKNVSFKNAGKVMSVSGAAINDAVKKGYLKASGPKKK